MKRAAKTVTIVLPEFGGSITIQLNVPMRVYDALVGGNWDEKVAAIVEIITDCQWELEDDAGLIPLEFAALRARLTFDEVKLLVTVIDREMGRFLREMPVSD